MAYLCGNPENDHQRDRALIERHTKYRHIGKHDKAAESETEP